ncbi:hypothetical protein [Streptomyces sp. SD15]
MRPPDPPCPDPVRPDHRRTDHRLADGGGQTDGRRPVGVDGRRTDHSRTAARHPPGSPPPVQPTAAPSTTD